MLSYIVFIPLVLVYLACDVVAAVIPRQHRNVPRSLLGSNFGIPTVNRTFDYVIVGGGNAGLTLASRLSENPLIAVAVVEAGSFYEITNGNISQIPALEASHWNGKNPEDSNPLVDWGFVTTPQAGINQQSVHYERGKTLGGCTALNYMAYIRPTIGTLSYWASLVADTSYTWQNFLQFYEKSVNFRPPNNAARAANSTPSYDSSLLPTGGPLDMGFSNYAQPFSSWMPSAFKAVGTNPINGFTSGKLIGSSWSISTLNHTDGTRASSETSFLTPALGRPNLAVYIDTLAEKIIFNGKTATGVLVNSGGAVYQLNATKEVIVSAGTFQSPQLLMVSGIGPCTAMQKLGIPCVVNLPGVGQNMNDHIYYGPVYQVNVQTDSALAYGDNIYIANEQFIKNQSGILSNTGGDFLAYDNFPSSLTANFTNATKTALASYPSDWPDLEYLIIPAYAGNNEWPGLNVTAPGTMYATIAVSYMKPISRGNISINSASMQDPPLINPAWLTSQIDVQQAIAAFRRARQVFQSAPLVKNVNIGPEFYPGSKVQTDAQILAQIQTSFNTVFHATSTCKMGAKNDSMAVVDSTGKVYGAQNLRIVDASALPFLPPGLPMSTVYALAEKIAVDIMNGN